MKKLFIFLFALTFVLQPTFAFAGEKELVDNLADLFSGFSADQIDNAVYKAKNRLALDTRKNPPQDLGQLFDSQISRLKLLGAPSIEVIILELKREEVLKKAKSMRFEKGRTPFLPVIPLFWAFTSKDQMKLVTKDNSKGYSYLNDRVIENLVTLDAPYYIFDVENGRATKGKSPEEANEIFKTNDRRGLTVAEAIALAVHTDVLSHHNVWAAGSRYESAGKVPLVYLVYGDRPKLNWYRVDYSFDHWGSASCGSC